MRIALDARWIGAEASGVGVYTRALIEQLTRRSGHELVLLFEDAALLERTRAATGFGSRSHVTAVRLPWGIFSARNQALLPRRLRRLGIDVFHSPNFMIPLLAFPRHRPGRVRCVVTLHDLIPMVLRDHAPRSRKSRVFPLYRRLMVEIGARADAIVVVSEASRRDVLAHLQIRDPTKVVRVYDGVGAHFRPGDEPRDDEVLYVGRFDPYKDVMALVDAFDRLWSRRPGLKLRLVGSPDPRHPEVRHAIERRPWRDAARFDAHLSDEELAGAYRRARVLVLPSRYEGFGLPVVEAMACGTPVVCTDAGALPEVAGAAALLVPTGDAGALAEAIERVLADESVAARLTAAGMERARLFTWDRAASETLAAYEAALA